MVTGTTILIMINGNNKELNFEDPVIRKSARADPV